MTKTFHRARRFLLVAACVAPLALLGAAWWLVSTVLLVPGVPRQDTTGDQLFAFIVHEKGLPRLGGERLERFLEQQIRRLVQEAPYRDRLLAHYRTAAPEERQSFRANLFDAFKPLVMRDVRRFHELDERDREEFLDERLIEYGRLAVFFGQVSINKDALAGASPTRNELFQLLLSKTSAEERTRWAQYRAALDRRREEILADPLLTRQFRERIDTTP